MTSTFKNTDDITIDKLLEEPERPKQVGPLRRHDKEMRCANRGCGSPTYLRVQGVSRCSVHALNELNEMLVEAGFMGVMN